jgi:hypothetical protein
MPARSFQVILNKALKDYHEQIGVDLNKHPFANELRGRDSPDKVLKLLKDKANAFKVYRDGNRKLITWLTPVVQVVHMLSGFLGEAVSLTIQMHRSDLFTIRLPGAYQTRKSDLCWRGCSNHGVYHLTFSANIFPDAGIPRQPTVSAQATMRLLNCLNVSETSSNGFGSIPISR